jgi:hypothetical protein
MKYPINVQEQRPVLKAILLGTENIEIVMRWIGANSSTRQYKRMLDTIIIDMLEGELITEIGWWVLRHPGGEFTTCNEEYFKENYEQKYPSDV